MAGPRIPFKPEFGGFTEKPTTTGSGLYSLLGGILSPDELAYIRSLAVGQDKGTAPKPDLSRSIYNYTPEQIDADINDVAKKVLGREIIDADRSAEWYQDLTNGLNKMFSKGTISETKLVKNKKTGKLEQITTQTPQFTTEARDIAITSALEAADPAALERKKNLEFANWAFQKMGGGR